ncbi:hypothetical protein EUGRSUZ_K03060 [Eucalyptus grandis]|uniref:Uncharacterized protein n=2 Tax=Eucalyptus grandis TaxID=71139 RepID=A0ACC3IZU0_EUCGR|nr:hypothetical protein EUGRSUZ_K03060 [Eucalyptus grandis]
MEGLIPFVYRVVVEHKSGKQGPLRGLFNESPSASYTRLPHESGRFQIADLQKIQPDCDGNFSTVSSSSNSTSNNAQIIVSSGVHSPVCRLKSRPVGS